MIDGKALVRNWETTVPIPFQRIAIVALDPSMPSAAKSVFTFAGMNADENYEFALSIHDIADAVGIGTASVSRAIAKLEEAGYITRKPRTYHTERNVINIAPPLKSV